MFKKIGSILVVLIVLTLAYKLIVQINDDLRSGDRLSTQAEQVSKLEEENKLLKKKLSLVQSPEFIEEEARNKLGLAKFGEVVVIIPEDKLKMVLEGSSSAKVARLPNYQGWFRVFWH